MGNTAGEGFDGGNPPQSTSIIRDFLPHPYQSLDVDGNIITVNTVWLEKLGYDREEVVGRWFGEFLTDDSANKFETRFPEFKSAGEITDVDFEMVCQDGERIAVAFDGRIEYDGDGSFARSHCQFKDISARIAHETQLEAAKQRFQTLIEKAPVEISLHDQNGNIRLVNEKRAENLGYSKPELSDMNVADIERSFEPEEGREMWSNLDLESTHKIEGVNERKDGSTYPVEVWDNKVTLNDEVLILAFIRDISDRREREAAIERQSEIRRLFSEVNHTLVRGSDAETVLNQVAEILGTSDLFECTISYVTNVQNSEVVCQYESDLSMRTADEFHTEAYLDTVFENGLYEIEDVTAPPFSQHEADKPSHKGVAVALSHGDERYGVLTVHIPSGDPVRQEVREFLRTISDDISYFIHNTKLEAEHKSFVEIVQRIDDPIMLQDRSGAYRLINEAVAELAGRSSESLIGKHESAFMNADTAQQIEDKKKRVLETEEPHSYQISPRFPDGTERTFSTVRYPYYDEEGQLDGTIAICRDVTDLEEHKQQLQVLDRVLRHNMTNNMTVVKGYASLVASDADGEVAEFASKIVTNTQEVLQISQKQRKITNFLSQEHTLGRFEIVSLVERLASQVENAHPGTEINVEGVSKAQVEAISAIEDALKELFINSIVHSDHKAPATTVTIESSANVVQIAIADDNAHISEMDRDIIRGETELGNVHHGSGLGLWLVKLIVDHSKGSLGYEPRDSQGNTITVELQHR